MITKNKNLIKFILLSLVVIFTAVSSSNEVEAYDYSGYDYGAGYDYGGYDYSGYDYGGYDYSGYDYGGYDYSGYDYGGYDYSGYDYGGYDYSGYDYGGYDYSGYDYGGYDYSGYDYGGYDYSGYDYGGYDYAGYDYGGYDSYSYDDYYTPSYSSGGVAQEAAQYYTGGGSNGGSGGCTGSNCGGGSRGSSPRGALGLNLNYSDDDVTITDNSIDANCSNVGNASSSVNNVNCSTTTHIVAANDDDDDLEIICRVSDTRIEEGDTVTYEVEIDGGRSTYRIEWDGDISGDDEEERVRYNRNGTYEVSVEVRDANGDRATDECPDVRVEDEDEDDDDDDDRRVTVTTGTNLGTPTGNLSSLDSVFLSQVPYTGASDVAKVLGIFALIAVWSTAIALYFKKQRSLKVVSTKISDFKEQNKNANKIA